MRGTIKKLLSLVLCGAMLAAVLGGCTNQETETTPSVSPSASEEVSQSPAGGVTDGTLNKEYVAQSALADSGNTGTLSTEHTVAVRNGNGVSGVAATASSALTNGGYDVTETGDADNYDYANTLIVYNDSSLESEARSIGETLGVGTTMLNDGSYTFDGNFLVILGADYTG